MLAVPYPLDDVGTLSSVCVSCFLSNNPA